MLGDIALLLVGAVLVNNFVLVQFLGLCPFMGVSNKLETAMGMSVATTFVLTCVGLQLPDLQLPVGSPRSRLFAHHQLHSGDRRGGAVHEMVVRKTSPLLHRVLGVFCR
ncbi:MAG: hypothetical protein CM15mP92_1100 [Halieaceae bacterium]|nr:MAG: hypothetical protein CM15mP92_1100 [Halieaceae bacterium]